MDTIPAINNHQIFLALQAASLVIESMEERLAIHGKSTDLQSVPSFYGAYFPAFIRMLAENIPLEESEKTKWKTFLAENIK